MKKAVAVLLAALVMLPICGCTLDDVYDGSSEDYYMVYDTNGEEVDPSVCPESGYLIITDPTKLFCRTLATDTVLTDDDISLKVLVNLDDDDLDHFTETDVSGITVELLTQSDIEAVDVTYYGGSEETKSYKVKVNLKISFNSLEPGNYKFIPAIRDEFDFPDGEGPSSHYDGAYVSVGCRVTFDAGENAEASPTDLFVRYMGNITETDVELTLNSDEYTFEGWYADSLLSQEFDWSEPVTENITVYAKVVNSEDGNGSRKKKDEHDPVVITVNAASESKDEEENPDTGAPVI